VEGLAKLVMIHRKISPNFLKDKYESNIFGYLLEPCTTRRFFLNFGPILGFENLQKANLILAPLIFNINFWLYIYIANESKAAPSLSLLWTFLRSSHKKANAIEGFSVVQVALPAFRGQLQDLSQFFCYWRNFTKKTKLKIKNRQSSCFGGFQSPESENKKSRVFILGFQCVAKIYKDE